MLMCGKLWSCVTWCFNTTRREVKVSKKKYAQDYLENCEYIHTAPTFALAIHNLCSQIPLGDFFCNLKTPRTCRVQLLSTSKQFSFFMYKKPKEIFKKKKTLEDWEQPTNKSFDQGGGSVKRSVCVERVSACVCVRVQVWSLTSRCTPFSFASDETWAKFLASGLTGSATTVTAILCLPELAGQCACSPPRIQLCLPASSLPSPRCTPRLANTWCINVKSKFEIAFYVFENVERETTTTRRVAQMHRQTKNTNQTKPKHITAAADGGSPAVRRCAACTLRHARTYTTTFSYLHRTTHNRFCLEYIPVAYFQRVADGADLKQVVRSNHQRCACILCAVCPIWYSDLLFNDTVWSFTKFDHQNVKILNQFQWFSLFVEY